MEDPRKKIVNTEEQNRPVNPGNDVYTSTNSGEEEMKNSTQPVSSGANDQPVTEREEGMTPGSEGNEAATKERKSPNL